MRNLLHQLLAVLDGTPAEYGHRPWRGQSVAELALVTPLLIAMLMALVEMGWFANNYLIMLEASRAGARFATTLPPERSPLEWDNNASLYNIGNVDFSITSVMLIQSQRVCWGGVGQMHPASTVMWFAR